ncbi:B3 domain-containing protein LOC_Os12g40080-like [Hibiscus syriacus]|uniref:B3 domain-containing protein LOC_Os12g40080-like n=1 Tax=Hibiscus syriacus TaxID=106335 RepID=UPI00192334DB|nr:B3 domain-containing protein LOC_Os12g40080-like [Hibiscus syriacus]
MASHHGTGSDYSPEPYHFFKIILESTIRDNRLGIPRKFARDYGNTLSSPVFFEVPNGEVWELELIKLEDGIWVQNGWRKFVEHYSLELGHFMVFRYQGNCRFHVLIFDRSASEIHYPHANDKEGIHQQAVPKIEEEDSVHIMNNNSTGRRKIMRADNDGYSAGKGEVKKVKLGEKSKALMRARSAFKSENPFFLVFMQPAYVDLHYKRSRSLYVPREFSRKYLMDHGHVVLRDSDGKTWSAEYRTILGRNERPYVKLCSGWGAFVRDNNIQFGDVCIFELIDCIDISFQVFICGGNHRSVAKLDAGISSTHQECLGPLKLHEALELPSEVSPEVDDNQHGTSKTQTGEDGLRSEKTECNAYPESSALLFSKNKTKFEKGEPTVISLDVLSSRRERPLVGSKPPVTPLSSPLPPSSSPGRFSRLQNTTPATYSEAALAKKAELLEGVGLKVGKSEVYTEEHEKLLDL